MLCSPPYSHASQIACSAANSFFFIGRLRTYSPTRARARYPGFMTSAIKLTRLEQINWRMRVTLNDGRSMTGQMLAFDKVRHITILSLPGPKLT